MMTTEIKLNMTDKNIEKNMSRLNKDTGYEERNNLLNYAFTKDNQTITTDSHRALRINQKVENDFTVEDSERFDKVNKLVKDINQHDYYSVWLNRKDINNLRKIAKFINSMSADNGSKLIEFHYYINEHSYATVDIHNQGGHNSLFKVEYIPIIFLENLTLAYEEHEVKTSFNAKYIVDLLDFAYDSKIEQLELKISGSRIKPMLATCKEFDYVVLPVRTY